MENIDILNGELFIPMNENSKPNLDDILMKLNYLSETYGIPYNRTKFFEKWDEYPIERFHEKMRVILEEMENKQQELPLLFSIPLDEEMSFLNITFCYNFIVTYFKIFIYYSYFLL